MDETNFLKENILIHLFEGRTYILLLDAAIFITIVINQNFQYG